MFYIAAGLHFQERNPYEKKSSLFRVPLNDPLFFHCVSNLGTYPYPHPESDSCKSGSLYVGWDPTTTLSCSLKIEARGEGKRVKLSKTQRREKKTNRKKIKKSNRHNTHSWRDKALSRQTEKKKSKRKKERYITAAFR